MLKTLKRLGACREALEWASNEYRGPLTAWYACERGDWMLWLAARVGVDRKVIVACACAIARTALKHVPDGELRPLRAIESAEAWARGESTTHQVRAAADSAAAYASDSASDAASAADAAYAAADAASAAYAASSAAAYAAYAAAYASHSDSAYAAADAADAAAAASAYAHAADVAAAAAAASAYASHSDSAYARAQSLKESAYIVRKFIQFDHMWLEVGK